MLRGRGNAWPPSSSACRLFPSTSSIGCSKAVFFAGVRQQLRCSDASANRARARFGTASGVGARESCASRSPDGLDRTARRSPVHGLGKRHPSHGPSSPTISYLPAFVTVGIVQSICRPPKAALAYKRNWAEWGFVQEASEPENIPHLKRQLSRSPSAGMHPPTPRRPILTVRH